MFYEVKVLDAKGNVKKVISPKALSNRFWKDHMGDNQINSDMRGAASVSDLDFEVKEESAEETPE